MCDLHAKCDVQSSLLKLVSVRSFMGLQSHANARLVMHGSLQPAMSAKADMHLPAMSAQIDALFIKVRSG